MAKFNIRIIKEYEIKAIEADNMKQADKIVSEMIASQDEKITYLGFDTQIMKIN